MHFGQWVTNSGDYNISFKMDLTVTFCTGEKIYISTTITN